MEQVIRLKSALKNSGKQENCQEETHILSDHTIGLVSAHSTGSKWGIIRHELTR